VRSDGQQVPLWRPHSKVAEPGLHLGRVVAGAALLAGFLVLETRAQGRGAGRRWAEEPTALTHAVTDFPV
jgi:hypothetical protein